MHISSDFENSTKTCRHAPQGGTDVGDTIAIDRQDRLPAAMAETAAVRSAHIVKPYELFSTLHPKNISPSVANNAAPTVKFENGAYAFVAHSLASRSSSSK